MGMWGIGKLPRRFAYSMGAAIASATYRFYGVARDNVMSNLRLVLPGAGDSEIDALTRALFRNYSRYLIDFARFKTLDREGLKGVVSRVEGTENVNEALAGGKGLILLTAHLGNWELGGIFFGRQDLKINVLTVRDAVVGADEIRERYRGWHNINTIVLGDSPFAVLEVTKALGRGEVVAMLVDRPVDSASGEEGVEVEFFGKPWQMPAGPMQLAKMTGAPIMPAFTVSEGDGYRAVAESLIYIDADREGAERAAAEKVVRVFEKYISEYPDQWYNFVSI